MAVEIDENQCTGCGICIDVCPVNAIKIEEDKAIVEDICVECTACVNQCPNEAISI